MKLITKYQICPLKKTVIDGDRYVKFLVNSDYYSNDYMFDRTFETPELAQNFLLENGKDLYGEYTIIPIYSIDHF